MPTISIVVPIYNVETYLKRCLESLHVQTFNDYEVLCVNDGCTDNSQSIIDEYVKKDHRFLSFTKENGGLSDARNFGLVRSKGEYIMFIDSDDFVEPNMLIMAYNKMINDKLDMVIFDFNKYSLYNNAKEHISNDFSDKLVYDLKTTPELLCYINNAAWNKLYRKSLFVDNHITYPFGYRHQDLGTTPKLIYLAKRIGFIKEPLYNYFIDRPNNLTQQYDKKIYHIIDMNREYLDYYRENNVFDEYYEQLKYLCIINVLNSLKKTVNYTDKKFVDKFIDDAFSFIRSYFKDYPKCVYNIFNEKVDRIYLNKGLLRMYLKYRQWKGKLS